MKRKLRGLLLLMIFSELVLACFMAYWLYTQYGEEREKLKKGLAIEFNESHRNVTDSLIMSRVIDPILSAGKLSKNVHIKIHIDSVFKGANKSAQHDWEYTSVSSDSDGMQPDTIAYTTGKDQLMASGVRMMLMRMGADSIGEMLKDDTARLKKAFDDKMQQNGWQFTTRWVINSDSPNLSRHPNVFISNFIDDGYRMEVNVDSKFVLKKILPQILFTIVLIGLTGFAFHIAYKSLKNQMQLSVMKNELISNMSHELKTPVSTVKLALEALNNFNVVDDRQKTKEYLEMASIEMSRLDQLINQSLNNALLEEGKISFEMRNEDLKVLTEEVLQTLRLRFLQNNTIATLDINGDNFIARVDKLHIQGVLINILDNSLKYGGSGVSIRLALYEKGNTVVLTISDNGPGIPAEYIDKVFDKLFRVPRNNEHAVKGYGLGLSYAKHVMLQHNGNIEVTNLPAGGCMFTLTFNKANA